MSADTHVPPSPSKRNDNPAEVHRDIYVSPPIPTTARFELSSVAQEGEDKGRAYKTDPKQDDTTTMHITNGQKFASIGPAKLGKTAIFVPTPLPNRLSVSSQEVAVELDKLQSTKSTDNVVGTHVQGNWSLDAHQHEQYAATGTKPKKMGYPEKEQRQGKQSDRSNSTEVPGVTNRPMSAQERGIDVDEVIPVRRAQTTPLTGRTRTGFLNNTSKQTRSHHLRGQRSVNLSFLHRKTFILPQNLKFGRFADEHPYWTVGTYQKLPLDDEFCDESYYANRVSSPLCSNIRSSKSWSLCNEEFELEHRVNDHKHAALEDTYMSPTLPIAADITCIEADSDHKLTLLVEPPPLDPDQAELTRRRLSTVVVSENTEMKRFRQSASPERAAGEFIQESEARRVNTVCSSKEGGKSFQPYDENSGSDENQNDHHALTKNNLRKTKPLNDLSVEVYVAVDKASGMTDTYHQPQRPPTINLTHQQVSQHPSSTGTSPVTKEKLRKSVMTLTRDIVVRHEGIQEIQLERVSELEGQTDYEQQLLIPRRAYVRHIEPSEVKIHEFVIRNAIKSVVGKGNFEGGRQSLEVERSKEQLAEGQSERRSALLGKESISMADLKPLSDVVHKIDPVYHRPLARLSVNAHDRHKFATFKQGFISPEEFPADTENRIDANIYAPTSSMEEVDKVSVTSVTTITDIATGHVSESNMEQDQEIASEYSTASSTEYIYEVSSTSDYSTPSAGAYIEKTTSNSDVKQTCPFATITPSVQVDKYEAPTASDLVESSTRSSRGQVREPVAQPVHKEEPAHTSKPTTSDTYRQSRNPAPDTPFAINRASGITSVPNAEQLGRTRPPPNDAHKEISTPILQESSIKNGVGRSVSEDAAEAIPEVTSAYAATSAEEDTHKPSTPTGGRPTTNKKNRNVSGLRIEKSRRPTRTYKGPLTPVPGLPSDALSNPKRNDRSATPEQQLRIRESAHYSSPIPNGPDTYRSPSTLVLSRTTRSRTPSPLTASDKSAMPRQDPAEESGACPLSYRQSKQSKRQKSAPIDERRPRSVIEPAVSHSVRRVQRTNSSDTILSREMEEFVKRHRCDPICYKLVCPKRLAESPHDKHDASVQTLTNLDILKRRQLSYFLAIEAQRFLIEQGSKYISATAEMLWGNGHTPAGSASDAALADDDNSIAESCLYENTSAIRNKPDTDNAICSAPISLKSLKKSRGQKAHGQSMTTTPVVTSTANAVLQKSPEPKQNKPNATEIAAQQMPGDTPRHNMLSGNRESVKAKFEGQIVCEASSQNSMRSSSRDATPAFATPVSYTMQKNARFALESWSAIWSGAPLVAVPQLSDHQIISLHTHIRHCITSLTTMRHVREALLIVINRVFGPVSAQQKLGPRDNQNSNWHGRIVRDQESLARKSISEASGSRQAPNKRIMEHF
ncbi:hypothetical protein BIW11_01543 [Tropilaelaps mercedesae]|uniref:Uncharacterized protein n=1 Tax=Tropilaelaps mercedesae TaxID=418985 RepID=A0A1V9XCE1_9ACAR|nr:hypothetical protein BIW11_01543 [Tropilaelaps mercedesae]